MKKEFDVVCFISTAKIPANNPMAETHKSIAIGLFINYKTGELVDVSSLYAVACVSDFLKALLIRRNIHDELLHAKSGLRLYQERYPCL